MQSITKILQTIFARFPEIGKPQRKFLQELFGLIPTVFGRLNFTNMARYSRYNESTFRRQFSRFFDWTKFNYCFLMFIVGYQKKSEYIGAIDCSFIPKAGKKTENLDKFWSGVAQKNKRGLEISVVSLIDVEQKKAWTIDARQTPAGLAAKEGETSEYSRVDFYAAQLAECIIQYPEIQHYVADGFYTKRKIMNVLQAHGKHLIGKLRPDANLNYLLDRSKNPTAHGNQKYDGKVNWKALNLDKWHFNGVDERHPHLRLYSQILYHPHFKQKFLVLFIWNARNGGYALLFSTDLELDPHRLLYYYQLRFQIEFIFRDAKQFTGLCHCQARDEDKQDFHFNMSLAALNIYRYLIATTSNSTMSMNSFFRKAYNHKLVKTLFSKLNSQAEFEVNIALQHPFVQDVINIGQMRA